MFTASMTKHEINVYLCAILTTLAEVEYSPESSIYLAIGADLSKWHELKALLTSAGLITTEFNAVKITDLGRLMADKINAAMR